MLWRGKISSCHFQRFQSLFSFSRSVYTNILINKEVQDGLLYQKPIVALESTIISHGMPYPHNLEIAIELENIIRSKGVIPATIAIIDGFPRVGLIQSELELLAKPIEGEKKIIKASRRDIAYACANRLHAGISRKTNFHF
jgi:pseudouridine-5'-phosphate glycosidase